MPEPIVTSPNPADAADAANLDADGNPIAPAQPQTDWENEANPYRKRYSDSQSQVQPLVRILQQFAEYDHNDKAWKPKTQAAPAQANSNEDFEKVLEGYDPEFKKALAGYTKAQIKSAIAESQKESAFLSEYNSGVQASRSKAMEEFGADFGFAKDGKMNTASPLYQLANEIITNKYAVFAPDGTFQKYTTPEAEYQATVEAYAILSKREKQAAAQPVNKNKLGAIQGPGSKAAGIKKALPYEEYNKLSSDEKDAYDLAQQGG